MVDFVASYCFEIRFFNRSTEEQNFFVTRKKNIQLMSNKPYYFAKITKLIF